MKQVSIHDVKSGMVTARNVYSKNESLLMGKGTTLSSDHIEQLSRLGIQSLWIKASDTTKDIGGEEIKKITREVEEMLDAQFELVSYNLIMKELKRVFTNYLIKKRTA